MRTRKELLRTKDLKVVLQGREGATTIVDRVNLEIREGETVGLIGETGSGKTIIAGSILNVLPSIGEGKSPWKVEGEIIFKSEDLLKLPQSKLRKVRGNEISLIPQYSGSSLHPIDMVGSQIGEAVESHRAIKKQKLKELVESYMGKVELSRDRYDRYAHQFSGGEAQRILIAMALINNPSLLIADEPTRSLDITVQRQVLELIKVIKKEFGFSMLLITHNLGIIAEMSDYIYVIYTGKVVEHSDVKSIFRKPRHPYTRGLLGAVPSFFGPSSRVEGIPGDPPQPPYDFSGCTFHPRCKYAKDYCKEEFPSIREIESDHHVACFRAEEI
ncbi:MAG: ABC transporter ATP-binding protein [Candidatus Hodarchaeota archaeon]